MPGDARLQSLFRHDEGAAYWFATHTGDSSIACSGLAQRVPPAPVHASTTFHCFSTTKPVTALAVLQLVSEGLVSLDAPLSAYLPDLPYQNGATLRQVMSHQAGLPSPLPLSWVHTDAVHATFDSAAFLARVLREHPTAGAPGKRARYSNIGYLLLGRLLEIMRGRPYPDVVRDNVLAPVARDAPAEEAYLGFELPKTNHAVGYTRRWSALGAFISLLPDSEKLRENEHGWIKYRPFHLNGAAYGGLKGNVRGWAPLLTALARRDARLLPAVGYESFFAPQSLASGRPTGHALSWFVGKVGRHDYLCHAGGGPGYGAEIRIYPALGAASALLTNTTIVSDTRHLDRLDASWLP
jgi:D-alanyl-D-alanine carboxypeptidase